MKIKDVEALVGITKTNIRFYEKEGLLNPERNQENNYREYTEADVEVLRKIKVLRMLDVPTSDIKLLNDDSTTLEEVLSRRLTKIDEQEAELREIREICKTIISKEISYDSLDEEKIHNEQIIDKNSNVWRDRLEIILKQDIVKEVLTRRQMNTNITAMLVVGYVLCAIVSLLYIGGERTGLIPNLIHNEFIGWFQVEGIGIEYFLVNRQRIILCITLAVSVLIHFVGYWTANIKAHIAVFFVNVMLLAPFLISVIRMFANFIMGDILKCREMTHIYPLITETYEEELELSVDILAGYSLMQIAGFWCILIGFVLVYNFLLAKWEDRFIKTRYALLSALVYTVAGAVVFRLTVTEWQTATVILAYLTYYIALTWSVANTDRNSFNRYYAIHSANRIMNMVGTYMHEGGKAKGGAWGGVENGKE